jgi:hypothetical protein
MDFTIKTYKNLLKSLQNAGFFFKTFSEYITENPTPLDEDSPLTSHLSPLIPHLTSLTSHPSPHIPHLSLLIILRHDVDLLPQNSLRFARIQAEMGIKGSYYFRAVPESWDEKIIKEIASLGHEVGYHYENMDVAFQRILSSRKVSSKELNNLKNELKAMSNERRVMRESPLTSHLSPLTSHLSPLTSHLLESAYQDFLFNLEKLRQVVPVSTICMHGSPKSKFDNKAIWDKYDYKALGLIGEPYYDMDFDKVFYLTDTGRRWDGWKVSVRDKVPQQELWNQQGLTFHSTQDIISAINKVKNEKRKVKSEVASKTLNFEPETLNLEHGTLNLEPETLNLEHGTLNLEPETLNLEHGTLNLEPGTLNLEHGTLNLEPETLNLPTQIMFTMHPQRWHDSIIPWTKELVMQNAKNVVKRWFFVR